MYIYDVQHDGGVTVVVLCIFMMCSMTVASHHSGCSMYNHDVRMTAASQWLFYVYL